MGARRAAAAAWLLATAATAAARQHATASIATDGTTTTPPSIPTVPPPPTTAIVGRVLYALHGRMVGLGGVSVSVLHASSSDADGGVVVGGGVSARDGAFGIALSPHAVAGVCSGGSGGGVWRVVPNGAAAGVTLEPAVITLPACDGSTANGSDDPTFTVRTLALTAAVGMTSLSPPPPPRAVMAWSAEEAADAADVLSHGHPHAHAITPLAGVGVAVDGVLEGVSDAGGAVSFTVPWTGVPRNVTATALPGPDYAFPPAGVSASLVPGATLPPLLAASQRVCGRVALGEQLLGVLPLKWRFVRLFRRPADDGELDGALPTARTPPRDLYYPVSVSAAAQPLWSVDHLLPAGDDAAADDAHPITTFTSGGNLSPLQPMVVNTMHARATARIIASSATAANDAIRRATGLDVGDLMSGAWSAVVAALRSIRLPDNLTLWLAQLVHGEVGAPAARAAAAAADAALPGGSVVTAVGGDGRLHAATRHGAARRGDASALHPQRALLPRTAAAAPPRRLGKMVGYVFTDADGAFCFPAVTRGRYHVVPAMTISEVDELGVEIHPLAYALEVGSRTPVPLSAAAPAAGACTPGAPGCRLRDLHFTIDWPTVSGAVSLPPTAGDAADLVVTLTPTEGAGAGTGGTGGADTARFPYAALPRAPVVLQLSSALPSAPPPVAHGGRTTHAWQFARVHEQLVQGGRGVSGAQYFFHELNDTGSGSTPLSSRFQRTLHKPRATRAAASTSASSASATDEPVPLTGGVTGGAVACPWLPGVAGSEAGGMLAVNTTWGPLEYAACYRTATQLGDCDAPPPPPGRCAPDVPAGGDASVRTFALHGVQPGSYRLTLTRSDGSAVSTTPASGAYTVIVAPASDATGALFRVLPSL